MVVDTKEDTSTIKCKEEVFSHIQMVRCFQEFGEITKKTEEASIPTQLERK